VSHALQTASLGVASHELGDAEFKFLSQVVMANAGIVLGPNKRQLVQGRLTRRLRDLKLASFKEYCDHLRNAGPEELSSLINAVTTNVTAFFRENHHFEHLVSHMLPEALERNAVSRRVRIWSAGCSSGEEPYSIAMTALEALPSGQSWDLKILATDIDSEMVAMAANGVYAEERLGDIASERQRRWFKRGVGANAGMVRAKPELTSVIAFRTLNLHGDWPMQGPFDVIFCRNVMIYFDQQMRDRMLQRFAMLLAEGGYLCIGHSESIHAGAGPYRLVGKTIYRKSSEGAHAAK